MSELTPLMKQYQSVKEQYPDAIVLFRLGDFYEMFGEDARVASKVLQIALTSRDKGKEDPMPMCGVPHFAADNYIAKLVKAGHKVALCEQVEDPKLVKGIVKREVVRVITPGTHGPEQPKENNYIMAVAPKQKKHGLALADLSTGEFLLYETSNPIEDELARYRPAEVVAPESLKADLHYQEVFGSYYVSSIEDWKLEYAEAYRTMLKHFNVASLEGFGCEGLEAAVSAGGALLAYLQDTRHEGLRFRRLSTLNQSSYMFMDATTQRNLELTANLKDGSTEGTLLWALDETMTPMGGRYLRAAIMRPLMDMDALRARLGAVKYLVEDYELIEALRNKLRNIQDLERLGQRVSVGSANARDLVALRNSLALLPELKASLVKALDPRLKSLGESLPELGNTLRLITASISDHPPISTREGGIIKTGFNKEVDELRSISTNVKDFLAALETQERAKTGIQSLKVNYNRIHGYYIEVTKSNLDLVPASYTRKQTLVGAERFITPELKELEGKVLGAEDRLKALEYEVFTGLLEEARKAVPALMAASASLAEADFLVGLAVVARRNSYCMPQLTEQPVLRITGGRHPVVERMLAGERFIPNDTSMDDAEENILIITGPNMAGKSTFMRQTALLTLMAQMGSFVPAEEATIGLTDRIFTRIGAADYLSRGQSTFMVEMVETANILNNATARSLIILDEVGRGTSTFDGISIAWSTAEYISKHLRARTLFATHYIELTDLSHRLEGIKNYNVLVKEWGEEIVFLRKIHPGPADKSYGIQVARLAGMPEELVKRAKEVLHELEKQHIGQSTSFRQMDLFSGGADTVAEDIARADLENMSPEVALQLLRQLKKRLR